MNLFESLGYQLRNIPILLSTVNSDSQGKKKKNQKEVNEDTKAIRIELMEYGINEEGIAEEWREILKNNMELLFSSYVRLKLNIT